VRLLRLVAGLMCVAAAAPAQLAYQQPAEKLLLLALTVKAPADSAMSIAVMDAAREKLGQMARYKVQVIPKPKLCEALKASDYTCDVLLDETQANQLGRFLTVNAYTTGTLERTGGTLTAALRVHDIGSSGLAALFTVSAAPPATAAALGDAIAQRLNTLIRAAEQARDCNEQRQKSQFARALDAARKALSIEPNLTAANLCIESVYEAERLPIDSLIAAALRATRGDSLNATAWEQIGHFYQQKGDTLKAVDAFMHELAGEPQNVQLRLGIVELLRQQKQYERAKTLLDEWLARNPSDQRAADFLLRICLEGELWRCVVDRFVAQYASDTTKQADSAFLKSAIGAAQQIGDTTHLLMFAHAAVRRFPKSPPFWEALGSAFDLKGQRDSSVWAYRQAFATDPNRLNIALLIAKTIVDGTVYDTAHAPPKADTTALRAYRHAFADRLDTARAYVAKALAAPDSGLRLRAAVILLNGGSKLTQAQAHERALPWLDQALQIVAQRTPADTVGPRMQIRRQASFWYGVASVGPLFAQYSAMIKSKSKNCVEAKAINDWLGRTKGALITGAPVHPPTANAMLSNVVKLETVMPQVKKQFKCTNF
jgi:tetratricopeptide (TPR) repeat protein